jgi:alpha-L-rhamnosidase
VWDASKRDRGRWMGDTDVSGPVIEEVFGDRELLEDTLDRLLGPDAKLPVDQHVNGIPGYSSFWFTGVADFYRHTGDKAFLVREHGRMLQLLDLVDSEFDERGVYANKSNVWLYVDWSPDLNGDTPETRRATTLEFLRAYREAAYLLHELGDQAMAAKYEKKAETTQAAANRYLLDGATGTFGPRWQTNAAAVLSGAAGPERYDTIWREVLSQVGRAAPAGFVRPIMSPYYGAYVLRAMAKMGHRKDALQWMRQYWGGMLQEGATSFWEAYDTDWYKEDFHSSLQADNRSGYFVSLAHGWSAGPTAWLTEEILGIKPTGAGFATVSLRPDLEDLQWARGGVSTPHGLLKVEVRKKGVSSETVVELPEGVTAQLSVPVTGGVRVNGKTVQSILVEDGSRRVVTLSGAGRYVVGE